MSLVAFRLIGSGGIGTAVGGGIIGDMELYRYLSFMVLG